MTTAHRPTFDPARGKEALRGPAYHQRLAPAHTSLKFRKPGQGGAAGAAKRDLRAELLAAEAAHLAKRNGGALTADAPSTEAGDASSAAAATKRPIAALTSRDGGEADNEEEDFEAKRRRVLEESRDLDADSEDDSDDKGSGGDDDDDDDDDSDDDSDDDDDAELQRELEKIRRERAEKREKEERERLAAEEAEREKDIALGNPLLNSNSMTKQDFNMKRRWDDDVVFKNQARGTEDKGKQKEFINDLLRSDFHKRFMGKYVR
ncbi:Pre-mRNA-splicing factor Cwf15/Cwc15 [Microdochium bolleyi]|uniref:Pre-mRNA-splicing factor Cwf15/Cwc15 n=1 Tax=Microdochium bolleyi TaxID=196109 RepID=A0A136JK21_9PEZI|nr:Pre-mRNA-splicing factor Cwf15/Cwc15 [Microdochium bolleyi]